MLHSGLMSAHTPTPFTDAGAHFGYSRTRRHPTAGKYILGTKDRTDILNVDLSTKLLEKAIEFVKKGSEVYQKV